MGTALASALPSDHHACNEMFLRVCMRACMYTCCRGVADASGHALVSTDHDSRLITLCKFKAGQVPARVQTDRQTDRQTYIHAYIHRSIHTYRARARETTCRSHGVVLLTL